MAARTYDRLLLAALLLAVPGGCGAGTAAAAAGQETGPCLDGGCFGGSICLSDVCVDPDNQTNSTANDSVSSTNPLTTTSTTAGPGTQSTSGTTTSPATTATTVPDTAETGPQPDVGGKGGACEGLEAGVYCRDNGLGALTCGEAQNVVDDQDCAPGVCVADVGCVVCFDGQFDCLGDRIMECDTSGGAPHQWVELGQCDPSSGERCNAETGMCEPSQPVGQATPTGVYFQYVSFSMSDGPFLGGYDVGSAGDAIYVVNTNGLTIDEYSVTILDSDADGELEPNQHPDNPDDPGPIEERVLTFVQAIDAPKVLQASTNEVFPIGNSMFIGGTEISETNLLTGATTTVTATPQWQNRFSQIAFDEVSGVWYASSESARRVLGYNPDTGTWGIMFDYPELAGSHMDGIEVVTDVRTGTPYIYVSDMTSTFLGQYRKDPELGWVQENIFSYDGTEGEPVEGMGFGALDHFWATSGATLFELGGGDLADFTER